MSPKNKKIVSIFLKVTILVLASYYIFKLLNHNQNLNNFNNLIKSLPPFKIYVTLMIVVFLMLVNWFIESIKWRFLVKPVERISIWRAVESVFCGLTWAIFTPNRLGEYGGRVFFLSPHKRILGAVAMVVGSISQLVITNVLGALAMFWFLWKFALLSTWLYFGLGLVVIAFCAGFILFYFNIRWLHNLLLSVNFFKSFRQLLGILTRYRKAALIKVMSYSLARFTVFTSQYCIVITMLIPGLNIFDMCMMIFILFFIQSALPSLDLLDIGVRSMTATYFFSFITNQEVAIIAVTACIWLVNLVIPAIIGTIFVFKLNFFGSNRS